MPEQPQWIITPAETPPAWFVQAVISHAPHISGHYAAQLLWQRGIRDLQHLAGFINPQAYQPASPFAFGQEIDLAVERLQKSLLHEESVAIWGDFDADGITATAVLWDGLGQFFPQNTQLLYYIPNRLHESHGLNLQGIAALANRNVKLIVTCDTGSTNFSEIEYAKQLGIDIIITDHHTLPPERPPVTAIINPRYLPEAHQLFHLSGVAVAYKLVEALYQNLPYLPEQPLENLLDLVAIGLIADLVQLSGDCRYLAQLGIERLQQDLQQPPEARHRPGVGRLLELCKKNGDRPTDISFGIGPRINAVSRIQGDASFCVELLTSRDLNRVAELAEATELANLRRQSLQKDVLEQVTKKLAQLDLSTTSVIVLSDPQWSVGVLGLVAGQVAQATGCPTVLLSTEDSLARGSARSVNQVDLYELVKNQAHLLHRFGGHPFAAGLSLAVENIEIFTEAINQQLRQQGGKVTPTVAVDLVCTVQELGKDLFWELKLLEPYGMGNPAPRLMIKNCWFENAWHRYPLDGQGKKVKYAKTEFYIRDDSTSNRFPGVWWGHWKEELPVGRCDCIVELDYNSYKNKSDLIVRLISVRSCAEPAVIATSPNQINWILDWRQSTGTTSSAILLVEECPSSWDELKVWLLRAQHQQQLLALAWTEPEQLAPAQIWQSLLGVAKYLSRTGEPVTRMQLQQKLAIGAKSLELGFAALSGLGFKVSASAEGLRINQAVTELAMNDAILQPIETFQAAVREEQFQRQYFYRVPLAKIQSIATEVLAAFPRDEQLSVTKSIAM